MARAAFDVFGAGNSLIVEPAPTEIQLPSSPQTVSMQSFDQRRPVPPQPEQVLQDTIHVLGREAAIGATDLLPKN
jgi:hypothetical protein